MAQGPHRSPDPLTLPLPEQLASCLSVLISFHERERIPFGKHRYALGTLQKNLSTLSGNPETYVLLAPFKAEESVAQDPLPWPKATQPGAEQIPTRPVCMPELRRFSISSSLAQREISAHARRFLGTLFLKHP